MEALACAAVAPPAAGISAALESVRVARDAAVAGGVRWLADRTREGVEFPPSPIGLYFASLWYSERLYPLAFSVSALARAARAVSNQ